MTTAVLPAARVAIAGGAVPSREWYAYFQTLQFNLDGSTVQAEIDALDVRVKALEDAPAGGGSTKIAGVGSIYVSATAIKVVSLQGDNEAPGFTAYYGTDATGTKGWYPVTDALAGSANIALTVGADGITTFDLTDLADSGAGSLLAVTFDAKGRKTGSKAATITGTTGRITVAHGDASDGLPTIDLATVADAGGGALLRFVRDAWGRITGTSAATTSDLTEGSNLYYTDVRTDARITLQKGQPSGLATLDAGGKLDAGQLPALAITETFLVATQAAMLALDCEQGDVAVRTDLSKSFILTADPPSTLANWQELLTPMSPVTSVFGRTGAVTAASGDYTPAQVGAEPAITAGTAAQYWRGDKTWRDFATDVRAAVLTGLSTATNAVIAAADTVLVALGKLQAQITALGSTVSGLITQSITNGDTTHAPSEDAVFDALAGKANDGAVLHLAGSGEHVTAAKYFDAGIVSGAPPNFWAYGSASTNGRSFWGSEGYFGTNGSFAMSFRSNGYRNNAAAWTSLGRGGDVGASGIDLMPTGRVRFGADVSAPTGLDITWRWEINESRLIPATDNAYDIGNASYRPREFFAANGAINTSDAREKTDVAPLTAEELAAAADLSRAIGTYQWLESVQLKGADARKHAGLTVQQAIAIMQAHGLDPFAYGFICYDEWAEQPEVRDDETGEITQEYRPAGDRYSFRHDELLLFIARGFAARLDALEAAR